MQTFKYGKFEGTIDITDIIVATRWEDALEQFKTDCQKADTAERGSTRMKGVLEAIGALFDSMFPGQNASQLILEDTTNLSVAFEALNALIQYVHETNNSSPVYNFANKYAPQNRAKRRASNK